MNKYRSSNLLLPKNRKLMHPFIILRTYLLAGTASLSLTGSINFMDSALNTNARSVGTIVIGAAGPFKCISNNGGTPMA